MPVNGQDKSLTTLCIVAHYYLGSFIEFTPMPCPVCRKPVEQETCGGIIHCIAYQVKINIDPVSASSHAISV